MKKKPMIVRRAPSWGVLRDSSLLLLKSCEGENLAKVEQLLPAKAKGLLSLLACLYCWVK